MKITLQLRGLLTILFSFLSVGLASAQINPTTGLPTGGSAAVTFDPATGQPIQSGGDWKDSNWKDPDVILTNVTFDGLAIAEVGSFLRERFHNEFDIVLPLNWGTVQAAWQMGSKTLPDWNSTPVSLQLKNVSASEIFNAMNLVFENDRVPLRWELKLNGNRRIALLRVLIDPTFQGAGSSLPIRRVYFVGNLIDDEKNGGMTMEQIIKTVTDVWEMGDAAGGKIQFHKDAQLLVVTGDSAQVDFVEQTLKALGQKLDQKRIELAHPEKYGTKPAAPAGK